VGLAAASPPSSLYTGGQAVLTHTG
jgi:hypothetical protein